MNEGSEGTHIEQFKNLFESFEIFTREQRLMSGPDFNIFELFSLKDSELFQSRFIAWLLNERESHHQGTIFLHAFIRALHIPLVDHIPSRYRVRTEFPGEEAILDILLYSPGEFTLGVENKVNAPEQPEQIDREYRDLMRFSNSIQVPVSNRYAVFLSPDGRTPRGGEIQNWHVLSYKALAHAFNQQIKNVKDSKLFMILKEWIEIWG